MRHCLEDEERQRLVRPALEQWVQSSSFRMFLSSEGTYPAFGSRMHTLEFESASGIV
jgi:hypothetical protein